MLTPLTAGKVCGLKLSRPELAADLLKRARDNPFVVTYPDGTQSNINIEHAKPADRRLHGQAFSLMCKLFVDRGFTQEEILQRHTRGTTFPTTSVYIARPDGREDAIVVFSFVVSDMAGRILNFVPGDAALADDRVRDAVAAAVGIISSTRRGVTTSHWPSGDSSPSAPNFHSHVARHCPHDGMNLEFAPRAQPGPLVRHQLPARTRHVAFLMMRFWPSVFAANTATLLGGLHSGPARLSRKRAMLQQLLWHGTTPSTPSPSGPAVSSFGYPPALHGGGAGSTSTPSSAECDRIASSLRRLHCFSLHRCAPRPRVGGLSMHHCLLTYAMCSAPCTRLASWRFASLLGELAELAEPMPTFQRGYIEHNIVVSRVDRWYTDFDQADSGQVHCRRSQCPE